MCPQQHLSNNGRQPWQFDQAQSILQEYSGTLHWWFFVGLFLCVRGPRCTGINRLYLNAGVFFFFANVHFQNWKVGSAEGASSIRPTTQISVCM